jgi:hypothetical protein
VEKVDLGFLRLSKLNLDMRYRKPTSSRNSRGKERNDNEAELLDDSA